MWNVYVKPENIRKCENVILIIQRLVGDEKFVTLADLVVVPVKFEKISCESGFAVILFDPRRKMAACSFHVAIAHVNSDD